MSDTVISRATQRIMQDSTKDLNPRHNRVKAADMYGISRIDDPKHHTHAWRVSFSRRRKRYVKNFPDKKLGGKDLALLQAKQYRDWFVVENPPLSRREFCRILRSNNRSGITGVYRYAKSFRLKSGRLKRSWYWEATWPVGNSEQAHVAFPVNRHGERKARRLAIQAREQALAELEGHFWACVMVG